MQTNGVESVEFTEEFLVVGLKDGRRISVPVEWYPRLSRASNEQLGSWQICGGGYGIHWLDLDEDLSTEGLLRGAPAANKALNADAGKAGAG
jgi:hypothetical protein